MADFCPRGGITRRKSSFHMRPRRSGPGMPVRAGGRRGGDPGSRQPEPRVRRLEKTFPAATAAAGARYLQESAGLFHRLVLERRDRPPPYPRRHQALDAPGLPAPADQAGLRPDRRHRPRFPALRRPGGSSRATKKACPSPPPRSSPRCSATSSWKTFPVFSPSLTWPKIRAILHKSTETCYYLMGKQFFTEKVLN